MAGLHIYGDLNNFAYPILQGAYFNTTKCIVKYTNYNTTMTGLADCNNFFVSCERTLDPSLEGRAVVVLSNNDGCAIARSNEAKRLGVKMGQPAFELRDMIESGQLTALSGNHLLYRDMSLKVHDIFRRFVPATTDYSVDEAFLDFTGIPDDNVAIIGTGIRAACMDELGIPVTIGISTTKTLAKVATHICKQNGTGVGILTDNTEIVNALSALPVGELWGIGRRLARRLMAKGIYTAGDFCRCTLIWVRSNFGVNGERSWRELHGEPCIELSHVGRDLQESVSESRTFPHDTDDYDFIRTRIAIYVADCARRLRAMEGVCGSLTVFLQSNRFHKEKGYHYPEAGVNFLSPQDDTSVLAEAAEACLRRIFIPGVRYKRAGVSLGRITRKGPVTPSLFDNPRTISRDLSPLLNAIDRINRSGTHTTLKLASQLTAGHPGHNDGYSSSFHAPDKNVR